MPVETNDASPYAGARINIDADDELRYWTEKFGCSAAKLKEVVEKVGTAAEKVERYIKDDR